MERSLKEERRFHYLRFPSRGGHSVSVRAMWGSPGFGQEAERGRGVAYAEPLLEFPWEMQGRAG